MKETSGNIGNVLDTWRYLVGNLFSCTVMVCTLLLGYTVIRKYLL